ncbi:beta-1,4-mannosyl-glycoprotein 4-beta-N-acetylglucosaminyltransferase [Coccinella septempunctata]|uniref:beta-1,4-mannosyl-glycoprotein 4-beta-N-acetylglucosaminyltransferase n=1 Tax=Coccinella septempunctata TaxID=41139 RepID=UPI001D06B43C|nr:beta-1,4-mannosyl-glycoprotein 4-beta-N-acetylglucosaminyltransferase [Coccinella septempunctata]
MYIHNINFKRISICILVLIQISLIVSYYFVQKDNGANSGSSKISFLNSRNYQQSPNITYHTVKDELILPKLHVRDKFTDFNSSLCFTNGTDLKSMERTKSSWTCECKTGWHGPECGQPEIVWRALLTNKQKLKVKGPMKYSRRVLYIFEVNEFMENIIDIRINELHDVIDMFIIFENEGNKIEKLLKNGFLKKYHNKILYIKNLIVKNLYQSITSSLRNLENNDIIVFSKSMEIPNKLALGFLKYYDNWPEPISFRLRWSVFGFFWKHPRKTRTEGIAFSVKYMKKTFASNFEELYKRRPVLGLVLGDLNHYGGWFCEYCMDPIQIIKYANEENLELVKWKQLNKNQIDVSYIEDLIGNGLYVDGKTELERSRKYQDLYFAPTYVSDNSMKYDFLLINLYTKLDYYEG